MPLFHHEKDVNGLSRPVYSNISITKSHHSRPPELGTTKSHPRITTFASETHNGTPKSWKPRKLQKWESPLLMISFFILGVVFSVIHCVRYASLNGTIVGSTADQESNLRAGTALAFLTQITLTASVWQTYHQLIWRSVKKGPIKMSTLNDIFGAETSVLSFLNFDMLKNFRFGYAMALFAWSLILPPFFTPGTLVVYDSTQEISSPRLVPYLAIANSSNGHSFSFSPSENGDRFDFKDVLIRVFYGPRTTITLLISATASRGEILPLSKPGNHSTYTLTFFGPALQCTQANSSTQELITQRLAQRMNQSTSESIREVQNAYYAFLPIQEADGSIGALDEIRFQTPTAGFNEVWMAFERYRTSETTRCAHEKHFQVCRLWNSTYDLNLSWENGVQTVAGTGDLIHPVSFPPKDAPGKVTEMARHAYTAYFSAIADHLVGSFSLFEETTVGTENQRRQFSVIRSRIQDSALLGSPDLAVFFDYNEDTGACQIPYANLSAQRQRDVDLARGRSLGALIEQLGFNATISLMHNELLTNKTERLVTEWISVNRYGYDLRGLVVPYVLACFFTFLTVFIGTVMFVRHGVMPGNKFQDILAAADSNVIQVARKPELPQNRHL